MGECSGKLRDAAECVKMWRNLIVMKCVKTFWNVAAINGMY